MSRFASAVTLVAVLGLFDQSSGIAGQATAQKPPVIGFHVVTNRKSPADIWVRAGQQATVGTRGGLNVGLMPIVRGSVIDLVVVRLAHETGGGEPEEVSRFEMSLGDVVEFDVASMHLEVTWFETQTGAAGGAESAPDGPCTICCVVCGGEPTCGCHVVTPCGHCCCPAACNCGSSERPSPDSASAACAPAPSARQRWRLAAA